MPVRNILFLMADQMRADCWGAGLGLAGAKLETPVLEGLAARGTVFTRAYAPAPVCGPSRMSFYTGLFPSSHGATVNQSPLPVGLKTLGDRMRAEGIAARLVGKTHVRADRAGLARLGLDPGTEPGRRVAEGGFDPTPRHDGLFPMDRAPAEAAYDAYLRARGYDGDNPWHDFANSGRGPDGAILSGWYLRNADKPAAIDPSDSETAWTTDRAIAAIREMDDDPWCLHVSYIKPHWPYIAPAPYCGLIGPEAVWAAAPAPEDPHPVHAAFLAHEESRGFRRPGARQRVIPTYLGLIRELDDHLGRLLAALDEAGRRDDTLIVLTADHGDYLGDHGLGDKQLFHDAAARVPLIAVHPDLPGGQVCAAPVEGTDLLPTFLHALGADPAEPFDLDGRSLLGLMAGEDAADWRPAALCETDYSNRAACAALGQDPRRARGWMLAGRRWKYIHWLDFPPQLFDLEADPQETRDRAGDPACAAVLAECRMALLDRLTDRLTHANMTRSKITAEAADYTLGGRIRIGVW
jgi:arylsulfatase A-like enzyme